MTAHYLYVEIDSIQRFVFASPKLKVIRGGSAMLDLFNRVEMVKHAKPQGFELIFAGGGHCLVRCPERSAGEAIGKDLERSLRRQTEGQATLHWAVAPEDTDWQKVWHLLQAALERKRLEPVPRAPPLPPFVALCSSCGAGPARTLADVKERHLEPRCGVCRSRQEMMHRKNELEDMMVWQRLRPHLGAFAHKEDDHRFEELLPERELQELAAQGATSQSYLAYLYCDGNGMGRALTDVKSAEEYGALSTLIDDAVHQAVAKAIVDFCAPRNDEESFRAQVLLLGGDDLIVALPADCAVGFTETVLKEFFLKTGSSLRLSAGLVFAPAKTPISVLQHTASALLRSAKRRAYLDEMRHRPKRCTTQPPPGTATTTIQEKAPRAPADGYIDFQELASAQSDIEREHAITCRPYRLDDFMTLVERIRAVRDLNVPKGRLHALNEAIHGSLREAHTVAQLVVGRARTDGQREALLSLLKPPGVSAEGGSMRPFLSYSDKLEELPSDLYQNPADHRFSPIPDALELIDHLGSSPIEVGS